MATRHLQVNFKLPTTVSTRLKAQVERESRVQTVLALWKRGLCSGGMAAKMLGLSFRGFLELLAAHSLSYVESDPETLASDRRTLALLRREAKKRRASAA
jgi:hypothetical protein